MDQGGDGIPNEENDNTEVNISDVLEAISSTDPERSMDAMHRHERRVNIVEQPASKALRFRYECEGRSAGSIPGVNSTPEKKTYPTIEIVGWTGKAVVVVSCVTKDKPYRPHPHNLVGREQCKKGLCTVYVDGADNKVTFNNLGIQCVRRRDIAEALKLRQEQNVDPFKTGFDHKNQPQSIDLNAVRLCFQVFLFDERSQSFRHGLAPVVSDIIYDKKAMSDLLIMRMSSCSGTAKGGTELILLCEKVIREETAVVFYETEGDRRVWEASAHIILVHKQVAIAVTTPPYRRPDTDRHARVHIQLRRTTDGACSPPVDFEYLPELLADTSYLKSKRRKTMNTFLQSYEQERYQTEVKPIKAEPRDKTPPHQMSSPPQVFPHLAYDHDPMQDQHQYQQWQMPPEQMQANLSVPGPSHLNPFAADMAWTNANYGQMPMPMAPISPNMQTVSPNMQLSPNMQVNPNLQAVSPMHVMPIAQAMSPHAGMGQGALSPHAMAQGGMSPHTGMAQGGMSPHTGMAQGGMSPHTAMGQGGMSPHAGMPQGGIVTNMGHVSPSLGHISPSLGHISANPVQQSDLTGVSVASGDTGSFSRLLLEGDTMPQLNSTELSGLTSMLGERLDDNISDGLNKLSF